MNPVNTGITHSLVAILYNHLIGLLGYFTYTNVYTLRPRSLNRAMSSLGMSCSQHPRHKKHFNLSFNILPFLHADTES